jgi:hypothetical protein
MQVELKSNANEENQNYQLYMLNYVIPSILNILELALVDEDCQVREMGLKIILNFTMNWEIN